ncbi:collagen alpha-1(XII) chain-like [Pecten maximus]|uniref:collagen alpha-1(XII) chain-like n=1 Tax=Pecten maximus TaxID=6579 RepID=UPI001458E98D|nr:collagen alpha-1(XII) chain-like [Pecten maximus]
MMVVLIDFKACGQSEQDIIFVLDSSTSVGTDNFREVLNFVKDLLSNADIDSGRVRVGTLIYSTGVEVRFNLNEFNTKADVFRAIDNIPYILGNTNTAGGIRVMSTEMFTSRNGDREGIPNIAFVITDGQSNINTKDTIPNAELARISGIDIYAIGIGLLETTELEGISSRPLEEFLFTVEEFTELQGLKETIFETVCPETPAPTTDPTTTTTTIPPTTLSACVSTEQDIVFVLDSSTSVGDDNFRRIIDFVKSFLNIAEIDSGAVRVGVLTYSTDVNIQFLLNTWGTKDDIYRALDVIPYAYGSTNTADALKMMRTEMFRTFAGDRPYVPNIAIVVTDGVSNINSRQTVPEADNAKSAGIQIYALGIGITEKKELKQIASSPLSDYLYTVEDFSELDLLQDNIFRNFCPVSSPTTQPVVRCVGVPQDLIFVLDSSTSVGDDNFRRMLEFVKDILLLADIDSGNVRVGVLIYSSGVEIQFHLNEYQTQAAVFQAIDKVPYILGSTNTADGLMVMRNEMFSFQHGDRPDVPNVGIVVTDGQSNINSLRTIPEANEAKSSGIDIYAIGIGLKETKELKGIASEPLEDFLYTVRGFEDLHNLKDRMFESICPGNTVCNFWWRLIT